MTVSFTLYEPEGDALLHASTADGVHCPKPPDLDSPAESPMFRYDPGLSFISYSAPILLQLLRLEENTMVSVSTSSLYASEAALLMVLLLRLPPDTDTDDWRVRARVSFSRRSAHT